MSGIFSAGGAGAVGASGSFYPVAIDDSLRWPTSGCQLQRTVGVPTDAKKHTHSFWVKVNPGTTQTLNSVYGNASGYYSNSGINSDGRIIFAADYARYYYSTMVLRDPSSWVHILQVLDSTEASNSDRMKLYVNGVRQTSFTNFATVPLNWTGSYHATNGLGLRIGRTYTGAGFQSSLLSYTSEYIFVDGQALDPTDFGQFQDGVWIPDTYAGTYGNNGYKLDFSNPSNIGEDSSGNGNDFSVTGLATHDVMPDTPTNNFATLNVLTKGTSNITLAEGNLKANAIASGSGSNWGTVFSSIPLPTTGKYYVEGLAFINAGVGNNSHLGVLDTSSFAPSHSNITYAYTTGEGFDGIYVSLFNNNAQPVSDGVLGTAEGSLTGTTVVAMLAVDIDNGKVWAGYDGTWLNSGDPSAGTNEIATRTFTNNDAIAVGTAYSASNAQGMLANFGQDSTFAGNTTAGGNTDANGIADFKHPVPNGFLALCTASLPTPTIIDGSEHFVPYLYTADNTSPKSRTGMGFSPDFLWFKDRTTAFSNGLYDTIRGPNKQLQTNNTSAENSYTLLPSFDADGFTTQTDGTAGNILNYSTDSYVTWAWKAGGTPTATNSAGAGAVPTSGSVLIDGVASTSALAGTIAANKITANTAAGFSIINYTGNGLSGQTVAHGLSSTPEFLIMKDRGTNSNNGQWQAWHLYAGDGDDYGYLSLTNAFTGDAQIIPNGTDTIELKANLITSNQSGHSFIMYAFHSVDGYSKAGSYVGNGSTDGPFVYTGFRPSWILIKQSSASGEHWTIYDTARDPNNVAREYLIPNLSNAAASIDTYDILSNGFKIRTSGPWVNASGQTYIYLAFAENPFKYSNAR